MRKSRRQSLPSIAEQIECQVSAALVDLRRGDADGVESRLLGIRGIVAHLPKGPAPLPDSAYMINAIHGGMP